MDWLTELQPDQLLPWSAIKAETPFWTKGEVKGVRAAYEALPSSSKDDPNMTRVRAYFAVCSRDFDAAEEIVRKSPNEEIEFFTFGLVPRQIETLWIEFVRGNHPTTEDFGAAREQLHRKVEADPTDPFLMTALAYADVALGRKDESMQEGKRGMELRPISEDAVDGPTIATFLSQLYALTNQPDAAFAELDILVKIPGGWPNYGDLKTNPAWEPLRKDPRFDKLLAELAPRD